MKILFSGNLRHRWMSGWQRNQTMRQLGHEVFELAQDDHIDAAGLGILWRCFSKSVYRKTVVNDFNRIFIERFEEVRPDIAWLEWPVLLHGETVRKAKTICPSCRVISFQDDNPFGNRRGEQGRWRHYIEAIPEYDAHFVKRERDCVEFKQRNAKRMELFMHGYFEPIFHPPAPAQVTGTYVNNVTFVGTPLDHRVGEISALLRKHKLPISVYGNRWGRTLVRHLAPSHFHPAVVAEDYVLLIGLSKINLAYVSSSNLDEYSMRTFEIPACGGFMLAERTPAHRALFEEGVEADFFSSTNECADKIRFYLKNETARLKIAIAGYERCLKSDYSLRRRMVDALDRLGDAN